MSAPGISVSPRSRPLAGKSPASIFGDALMEPPCPALTAIKNTHRRKRLFSAALITLKFCLLFNFGCYILDITINDGNGTQRYTSETRADAEAACGVGRDRREQPGKTRAGRTGNFGAGRTPYTFAGCRY
jgi:hypothetical protein